MAKRCMSESVSDSLSLVCVDFKIKQVICACWEHGIYLRILVAFQLRLWPFLIFLPFFFLFFEAWYGLFDLLPGSLAGILCSVMQEAWI